MPYLQFILWLLVFNSSLCLAQSPTDASIQADELPTAEMLEFLSEWDSLDNDTWLILEQHALDDIANNSQKSN